MKIFFGKEITNLHPKKIPEQDVIHQINVWKDDGFRLPSNLW